MNCFSQVESACENMTFDVSETGAIEYMNYIIATLSGGVNLVLSVGLQGADEDLLKAALALRCLLTSGFDQTYRLILAVYYALRPFSLQTYWTDALQQSVPYICSCQLEIQGYAAQFGGNANATNAKLQFCSEASETRSAQKKNGTFNQSNSSQSGGQSQSGGNGGSPNSGPSGGQNGGGQTSNSSTPLVFSQSLLSASYDDLLQ